MVAGKKKRKGKPAEPAGLRWPPAAWLGMLVVLSLIGWAWVTHTYSIDSYREGTKEDGWLEWATVWAFLIAAVLHGHAAWVQRGEGFKKLWFSAGICLFCLFVAGEEISWGQRLFGFRPPEYFLAQNVQQELNFHNAVSVGFRSVAFNILCFGYGVLLPLLATRENFRALFERLGLRAPALQAIPAFLGTGLFAALCPYIFRMEVAEALLGVSFLLVGAVLPTVQALGPKGRLILACTAPFVVLLGVSTSRLTESMGDDPQILEMAKVEAASLRLDFIEEIQRRSALPSVCGTERRMHDWAKRANATFLDEGHFRALGSRGLPELRSRYFLDPWEMPYWLHHMCLPDGSGGVVFVLSFGPNRRRDSTPWALAGDDIGYVIVGQSGT